MVQTRSASSSPVKKQPRPTPASAAPTKTPSSTPSEAVRLLIAPKNLSHNARFVTLVQPSAGRPTRYLFDPTFGVHELTSVDVPQNDPRSTLLVPEQSIDGTTPRSGGIGDGHVNKKATYVTATPFDMTFALLPLLTDSKRGNLYQNVDDLLEDDDGQTGDMSYILRNARSLVEDALRPVCDTVEAGEEPMYRYSKSKTLGLLISKAQRVSRSGFPASMEDKFVTRALETPMLSVKREESTTSATQPDTQDTSASTDITTPSDSFDSQSSATSAAPSAVFSEPSAMSTATSITSIEPSAPSASEEIRSSQRFLTVFKYICASYLAPSLSQEMQAAIMQSDSPIDLSSLTTYTAHLAKLRAEAAASADFSSFSRKRGGLEAEEEAEARAEKRRRLEEEEKKKKANTSRGVKELAKVDTKGMKKMSSFFTKMPAKGKT